MTDPNFQDMERLKLRSCETSRNRKTYRCCRETETKQTELNKTKERLQIAQVFLSIFYLHFVVTSSYVIMCVHVY